MHRFSYTFFQYLNLYLFCLVKTGELICPNINRTLVKKINCSFLLYTQNKLESYIIDYDDTNTEKFHAYGKNVKLNFSSMLSIINFFRKFGELFWC